MWWAANMSSDPVGAAKHPPVVRAPNGVVDDGRKYWSAGQPNHENDGLRPPGRAGADVRAPDGVHREDGRRGPRAAPALARARRGRRDAGPRAGAREKPRGRGEALQPPARHGQRLRHRRPAHRSGEDRRRAERGRGAPADRRRRRALRLAGRQLRHAPPGATVVEGRGAGAGRRLVHRIGAGHGGDARTGRRSPRLYAHGPRDLSGLRHAAAARIHGRGRPAAAERLLGAGGQPQERAPRQCRGRQGLRRFPGGDGDPAGDRQLRRRQVRPAPVRAHRREDRRGPRAMSPILDGLRQAAALLLSRDPEVWAILWLSLQVSGTATLVALLIGVPLGAILALARFAGRGLVVSLVNTGMGVPPVVVGLFVSILLWRSGPLGELELLYTPAAIVVAQAMIAAPIVTGITLAAVQNVPEMFRLQLLALGASRTQMVWVVLREAPLPLLAAVMAGFGR